MGRGVSGFRFPAFAKATAGKQVRRLRAAVFLALLALLAPCAGAATHYVSIENTTPASPYTSWATAATNIQDAVDAATWPFADDTILVSNGVYATGASVTAPDALSNRVVITIPVLVKSVNGPEFTTIRGQGPAGSNAVRCAYVFMGTLSGFTLTDGHTMTNGLRGRDASGGAAYAMGGTLTNCVMTGNSAFYDGGATYYGIIRDCAATGNWAGANGGAMLSGDIAGCSVAANTAMGSGGGVYGAALGDSMISSNHAAISGGGIAYCLATRCVLRGNTAEYRGAGALNGTVRNSVLFGNAAQQGGGSYGSGLVNCTVSANTATLDGGGLHTADATNCVVYYNTALTDPNYAGGAWVASCTTPDPGGTGNITDAPVLVSASHLSSNSPCLGAGDALYASDTDIDDDAWLTPPAMGCDEYVAGSLTGPLTVSILAETTQVSAASAVGFTADIRGKPVANEWDFGDGETVTNRPSLSHTWAAGGTYAVVLRAFNLDYPLGVAATVMVEVTAEDIHYADANSLAPQAPYTNWATAADNIQDAVDACPPGGRVVVTNGLYAAGERATPGGLLNCRVVITNDITVESVGGPGATVIRGAGPLGGTAVRCVFMAAGTLSGFTLTNGHTRIVGGLGLDLSGGGADALGGTLTNCFILGNVAHYGGGASRGTVLNCTLALNNASLEGGATWGGYVCDSIITNNSADFRGGGTCDGTVERCTVSGNRAVSGGGTCRGILKDCAITHNQATLGGGGSFQGALTGCDIGANDAAYDGGGSYAGALIDCRVTNNAAGDEGGGTYAAALTNCTVAANTAGYAGGGVYQGVLDGCAVSNNTAPYNGGGICWGSARDCAVSGNTAASGGGTFYVTLTNCSVTGNAAEYGGGTYRGELRNCTVRGNTARQAGGGVCYGSATACAVSGNTAGTEGGGAYDATLTHCTVTGNRAGFDGGGTHGCTVNNGIVYFNTADGGANYAGGDWGYSCTTPLPGGTGNIDADPLLVSASRLATNSPCLGAGHASHSTGTDLDGDAWLDPPAMGCDQPGLAGSTGTLSVAVLAGTTPVAVGHGLDVRGVIQGRASANRWTFGDGTVLTNVLATAHAWAATGTYEVVLSAFNLTYPAGVSATVLVEVVARPVHYVCAASTNPVPPYTSWTTSATNIQVAVDLCQVAGGLVLVSNGTYAAATRVTPGGSLANRVVVTNDVVVRSVNGPRWTVVRGEGPSGTGAVRCAYVAGGVLSGFTLTNGHTRTQGAFGADRSGGGAYALGGLLTNCIVTGNEAGYGGGVYRGRVNNSVLTGNEAAESGGGGYDATFANSAIHGNTATRGGGAYGGHVANCTLTGNNATHGGGSHGGTLRNAIVYFNTADSGQNYESGDWAYSCVVPHPGGAGNITNDPRLVSAQRIATNSPCAGAGSTAYRDGVDIDGETWQTPPAMGCDEPLAASATGTLAVAIVTTDTSLPAGSAGLYIARITGKVSGNAWTFGDGDGATNRPHATHAWSAPGAYEVVLTAYNDDHPGGVSATATVAVAAASLHYVRDGNTNAATPYTNWHTAAAAVQDAVDVCPPGGLVLVSNGTYQAGSRLAPGGSLPNRLVVTNAIVVESMNGPAATAIAGQGPLGGQAERCVYLAAGTLRGFTLTNGHTRASGAAADQSGGGAYALGGSLERCIVAGNTAALDGGGTCYGSINNCLVVTNTAADDGGGTCRGTLRNSTVTDNTAWDRGGGTYEGDLANSIVYYNTAYGPGNYHLGTWRSSCTTPAPGGSGNITNAPGFVDRAGGDLRLGLGSACIDAGNSALIPGTLDLDGNARIAGSAVDMGAYEYDAEEADFDSDGMSDAAEDLADTDPADAGSLLRFTATAPTNGGVLIRWQGGTQARQFLECRRSLTAPDETWVTIFTNEPPTPDVTQVIDAGATNGALFYRVRVDAP